MNKENENIYHENKYYWKLNEQDFKFMSEFF